MTAEEQLRELYEREKPIIGTTVGTLYAETLWITPSGGVHLAAEQIDLIAKLVVERLKGDKI